MTELAEFNFCEHQKKNGFTLIELAVSLVVMGLIVAASAFGWGAYVDFQTATKQLNGLNKLCTGLKEYQVEAGTYPLALPAIGGNLSINDKTYVYNMWGEPVRGANKYCPTSIANENSPYAYVSDGVKYTITTCLFSSVGGVAAGPVAFSNCQFGSINQTIQPCVPNCGTACGGAADGCGGQCYNPCQCNPAGCTPATPVCQGTTCGGCTVDSDCQGFNPLKYCDLASHACTSTVSTGGNPTGQQ